MSVWSDKLNILIVYYSRFGVIEALAEEIAEGVHQLEGYETSLLRVTEHPIETLRSGETERDMLNRRAAVVNQIHAADALVVGAPSYFGSPASPVKRLFEDCATLSRSTLPDASRPWHHHLFRNKVGAAFTSSATPHGGNEQTLQAILTMLMHLGMIIATPGQGEPILENPAPPYGATVITGASGHHELTEGERAMARDFGQRVAEVTAWLWIGRLAWSKQRDLRDWEDYLAHLATVPKDQSSMETSEVT